MIKKLVLLIATAALGACAGSGEGGAWTPQDTAAATGALNNVADTYQRIRYAPAPVYAPVTPVVPVYHP